MFQELMPLLAQRTLLLTLSRVDAETICVNVIPQRTRKETEENSALTTPLSLTGTPQELDQQLPQQLTEFVGANLQLASTLRTAKEEMDAAGKAAKESARKSVAGHAKAASAATKTSGATAAAQSPSNTEEQRPDSDTENQTAQAEPPTTGSLFAPATA